MCVVIARLTQVSWDLDADDLDFQDCPLKPFTPTSKPLMSLGKPLSNTSDELVVTCSEDEDEDEHSDSGAKAESSSDRLA